MRPRPLIAVVLSLVVATAGAARAQFVSSGETYYIPLPSAQVRTWAEAQTSLPENNTLRVVIGLTVTADGAILYYDHWEDGFEFDVTNPTSPGAGLGAEIWGDMDCSNGHRPDIGACTAAGDHFDGGDVLILTSDVPVPGGVRDPAQIRFDGGDKLFSTELLAVTYASWPSTGIQAQLGDAVEVFGIEKWGSSFRSPVGTDVGGVAFDFSALSIMARENGTRIDVDADGPGAGAAVTFTLDQGESVLVQGILHGATVVATAASGLGSRTVQVNILTATPGSDYEGRWFSLPPTASWGTSYYAPAGSSSAANPATVYLYNPNAASLVVTFERLVAGAFTSSTITVAAGATVAQALPSGAPLSGARFSAASPFFAVAAIAQDNIIYDWGHSLVPETALTPSAVVGWAPGSTNLTQDVNPLWVTPVLPGGGTTTIYIDRDSDPTTPAGGPLDPLGNRYDVACTVANLRSMRVFDDGGGTPVVTPAGCSGTTCTSPAGSCVVPSAGAGDNDQTGMRLYTVDGTRIAAAWGQDVSLAGSGQPQQLDMGTTVVPFASLNAFKDGALLVDLNGNGGIDPGDTILYTTVVRNIGITPVTLVRVTDVLDPGTSYIAGTFEVDGLPIADDASGTAFPLDTDPPHPNGFVLVEAPGESVVDAYPVYDTPFLPGGRISITYQVVVLPTAVSPIVNRVAVSSNSETFVDTASNPIPTSVLQVTKTSNVPASGAVPGQSVLYTVTLTNPATSPAGVTGVRLIDPVPAGTTYVSNSTTVTGPRQLFVADRFGTTTASYANSNGPNPWDSDDAGTVPDPWTEINDGTTGPGSGDAQVVIGPGGGELRLDNVSGGAAVELSRPLDLSTFSTGFASFAFDFRVTSGVDEITESIAVECSGDGGGTHSTLGFIDWIDGDAVGTLVNGRWASVLPASCRTSTNRMRLRVAGSYTSADEAIFVDNVELRAVGTATVSAQDDFGGGFPGGGAGWSGPWTLGGTPTASGGVLQLDGTDSVTRSVNLAGTPRPVLAVLSFSLGTNSSLEDADQLEVEASTNGTTFTTLARFQNDFGTAVRSFDLTPYISATTTIRFRIGGAALAVGELFVLDDVRITTGSQSVVTKDNVTGGANPDLLDGVPADLALPADSFALAPGESLTAQFSVTVDDPQPLTRLVNTVSASAFETVQPVRASRLDPVARGGIVGDRVWLDVDRDGVQDVGEPGLAGVAVELRNGVCTPGSSCPTVVTNLDGGYLFTALRPGSYTAVVIAGVPAGLGPSPYPPAQPSVVTANEVFTHLDFGYVPGAGTAVIGDRVWADADGDGIQDPGEIGIGGVTVDLLAAGGDGVFGTGDDVVVATRTTGADGSYLFGGVVAGTYAVRVSGTPLAGRSATSGPQSMGSTLSPPLGVAANEVRSDVDFGFTAPGTFTITDTFWVDEDLDGVFDAFERPLAGVTVSLRNASNAVVGTATSLANGTFTFSGVPNGGYTIVVTDTAGRLVGRQRTTPDAAAGQRAATVAGANVTGVHFGYAQPGLIGDRVWSDANGDGVQDANEPGLGGVTVELLGPGPDGLLFTGDDQVLQTTISRADGNYEFPNLVPGGYRVRVPVQAATSGYTQTGDPNFPDATCVGGGCDRQGSSTLPLGGNDRNLDFGFRDATRPDVSGTVYEDRNRNGVLDPSGPAEAGIGGVEVALVAAGTDGVFGTADDQVVATATTAANGTYSFPDVANGSFRVEVRDGAGVLDDYQLTSGRDQIPITVSGTSITGIDFGYARSSPTGSIGDTLWIDVDPPGADPPDGLPGPTEPRLPGVTVNLYRDLNGNGTIDGPDGAPIATTVTDVNGQYLFGGLTAGGYLVDVVESTLPNYTGGAADLVETTYPPGVNPSRVINLSQGQLYEVADFGYRPIAGTVILGDFLWYDADGDALQDPGETGIPGIGVNLIGDGADGTFGTADDTSFTTTTRPDGTYLFTGLAPDRYLVTYDQSHVIARGLTNQPTNLPPGERTFDLTTVAGDVITTLDFGFNGGTFGSIGDLVWLDADNNGVQGAGEPGIAGVTINLRDDLGNVIASTTTDLAGGYRFTGRAAGSYTVHVSDVHGQLGGLRLTSGSNPTGTITLAAGQNDLTRDFGYVSSGGAGTIGTTVWRDLNADGTRQSTEPPIEGVAVDVYFDNNGNNAFDPGIDNRIRTVVTDAAGNFELLGLPPGRYFVDVTDTAGVTAGLLLVDGPNDGSDDNSQVDPYSVLLTSLSPNNLTADFGYRAPLAGPRTISGTVFVDADANGTFQSATELRVQGATLRLYRIVGGGRELIGITTSAVDGTYSFTGLPDGSYEVRVDPEATSVDGFLQTTQTTSGGVQPVTLAGANSANNNFGFFSGGVTTTPVTLASFEAEGGAGHFTVRWSTATEVGHVGFNLWLHGGAGWKRVNEQPIASPGGDTLEPRHYELEISGEFGSELMLQELDVKGRSRFHGPFLVGRRYGHQSLGDEPIDWKAIASAQLSRQELLAQRAGLAAGGSGSGATAILLRVTSDGIHRITYEQLAAAGLDLHGADSSAIAVTTSGQAVPIRVACGASFGPGCFVELVASALDTLYTGTNVYRLAVEAGMAARVTVDAVPPTGSPVTSYREPLRVERQRTYSFASPSADPWYDTRIIAFTTPAGADFPFETEGRLAGDVTLKLELWGVTDHVQSPDHHALVEVNGLQVGEATFDGNDRVELTLEVPESALSGGVQTLRVTLPGDTGVPFDVVDVDQFVIEYPRQLTARNGRLDFTAAGGSFQVSGLPSSDVVVYREVAGEVELLAGATVSGTPGDFAVSFPGSIQPARYLVSTQQAAWVPELAAPRPAAPELFSGEAELLVIAHPDFLSSLEPLAERRRSQGWSVKVVDVEDIYSELGHDIFDPLAIRSYVKHAAANLETRAVLLVGGDSYDYRNYLGLGSFSFLPTLYAPSGDIVRFAPADGLLADTNGDLIPNVAIGRFPVRTSAEADALVAKTLAYEELADRQSLLLVADGYDPPSRFSFTQASEELALLVPMDWQVDRVFLDHSSVTEARTALLAKLDGGVALTSYMGHSGPSVWTFDGLFSGSDVAALSNAGAPSVVMQWGCWTSYFVDPAKNTLAHRLLLPADRGAAAVLGATTLTEARSERAMSLQIFSRAFRRGATLGEVILRAKRTLALTGDPAVLDVLLGWNLLGDPTLVLRAKGGGGGGGGSLIFEDGFEDGLAPWSSAVP